MRGTIAVLAVAILLLPMASAAASGGQFTVRGALQLGAGARGTYAGIALYNGDAATTTAFTARMDRAQVCDYTVTGAEVDLPGLSQWYPYNLAGGCSNQTDLAVTLVPSGTPGWLGLRMDESGVFQVAPSGDWFLNHSTHSVLASPPKDKGTAEEQDQPSEFGFKATVNGDHLLGVARGTVTYAGRGELKIDGPRVHVESLPNGSRDVQTGAPAGSSPIRAGQTERWLVLIFDNATVTITNAASPMQFAAQSATITTGGVAFDAISGTLNVGAESFKATSEPVTLAGDLRLGLKPGTQADTLDLQLSGDVQSVSLAGTIYAPAPAAAGFPWVPLMIGAALLSAGGVGLLVFRKGTRSAPTTRAAQAVDPQTALMRHTWAVVSPSNGTSLALIVAEENAAAVQGHYEAALFCARLRAERTPDDPEVHHTQGVYLRALGELEAALGAFEVAAHLGDSFAKIDAAALAARLGERDAALRFLDVLETEPELVGEVLRDPAFGALRGDEAFEFLVARARAKLGR